MIHGHSFTNTPWTALSCCVDHGRHCQMYLLTQYVVPDFRWWMEVSAASSRTLPPSTVPYTTQWSPACMVQRRARTGRSGSII